MILRLHSELGHIQRFILHLLAKLGRLSVLFAGLLFGFIVSHGCHGLGSDHSHDEDLEPGVELVQEMQGVGKR